MKLQYAMDYWDDKTFLQVFSQVRQALDIVEVGTPAVLRYGARLVQQLRSLDPDVEILADFKICDGGTFEADSAFDAGADIVTAMGFTNTQTIQNVIASAKKHGKKTLIDMMRVEHVPEAAKHFVDMGADYICLHSATDNLDFDGVLEQVAAVSDLVDSCHIAWAGGINLDNIARLKQYDPAIIIVGNSVHCVEDKAGMLRSLREKYEQGQNNVRRPHE